MLNVLFSYRRRVVSVGNNGFWKLKLYGASFGFCVLAGKKGRCCNNRGNSNACSDKMMAPRERIFGKFCLRRLLSIGARCLQFLLLFKHDEPTSIKFVHRAENGTAKNIPDYMKSPR